MIESTRCKSEIQIVQSFLRSVTWPSCLACSRPLLEGHAPDWSGVAVGSPTRLNSSKASRLFKTHVGLGARGGWQDPWCLNLSGGIAHRPPNAARPRATGSNSFWSGSKRLGDEVVCARASSSHSRVYRSYPVMTMGTMRGSIARQLFEHLDAADAGHSRSSSTIRGGLVATRSRPGAVAGRRLRDNPGSPESGGNLRESTLRRRSPRHLRRGLVNCWAVHFLPLLCGLHRAYKQG